MNKLIRNKKAQKIFVLMMVSILVLILIIILSTPLLEETQRATNGTYSSNLNTSNPNMTIPNSAALTVINMSLFYFLATLVAVSISYVSGRKSFNAVISAIMVFVVVSILISPLKVLIVTARDSTHLNCSAATVTVGQSLSCIFVDIWLFYFAVVCIFAAATFIFIKTTKAT